MDSILSFDPASAGWRHYPPGPFDRHAVETWFKQFDTATRCALNSDNAGIQLSIVVYRGFHGNATSVEVKLIGEKPDGEWVELKAYGIDDPTFATIESQCAQLLAAWEAMCAKSEAQQ